MTWYVVRHPEVGAGIIPETSLQLHLDRGWKRVSDGFSDLEKDTVDVDLYRVDLDADSQKTKPSKEK